MRYILSYITVGRRQRLPAARTRTWRLPRRLAVCLTLLGLVAAPAPLVGGGPAAGPVDRTELLVFAAASTSGVLQDAAAAYAAEGGGRVRFSFASTSALARQIETGAPADLFLSANAAWMDRIEAAGFVAEGSRTPLFRNRLVLIAPSDSAPDPVAVDADLDLGAMLGNGRLAIADPASVPAGIYARQALTALGMWAPLKARIAPAADVRHATTLVRRGEAPLGIVYWTDARSTPGIEVLGEFDPDLHEPIIYWAAQLSSTNAATAFLTFLQSPGARTIFARHGFAPLPDALARRN